MREVDLDTFAAELADGALVIDVREFDEYATGHAPGALSLPLPTLGAALGELPADGPVYVICASGNRSAWAAEHLAGFGVDAVSVVSGTAGWARAGRPLAYGTGVRAA
ncbi:rhodanese-like domain-containing protein [Streptomyces sp. NPDC047737]|uniref:rhodanese-like domain-containing protein n=1 Tax=unclassified Streptomyces TaxID=2593676 RepID=UPI0033E72B02